VIEAVGHARGWEKFVKFFSKSFGGWVFFKRKRKKRKPKRFSLLLVLFSNARPLVADDTPATPFDALDAPGGRCSATSGGELLVEGEDGIGVVGDSIQHAPPLSSFAPP
jgi:hypothetical protein